MGSIDTATATAALAELAGVDVGVLDRDGLDAVVAAAGRIRGFCDAVDVQVARRARQLAEQGRSESADGVLAHRGRRSTRDARAAAERATTCGQMPSFEAALATGAVSSGHLDAVASATHGLSDEATAEFHRHEHTLRRHAETHSVEEFTRECRDLARTLTRDEGESRLESQRRQRRMRRWVDRHTGMHHLHAELDPEAAAKVNTAIDAATRARRTNRDPNDTTESPSWDHDSVDALVELITGARSVEPRVPEIAVHIDWDTLLHGLHDHSLCETGDGWPLPPSTVRRLCCQAEIFPVVLNGLGEVLDVGTSRRLANRAQRRALRAIYRTCGFDDCTTAFDRCEIHHVVPWEHGGATDLANLIPICALHHHLLHEGGWTLTLGPGRQITITRPDGTIHFHGTTIDRHPNQPIDTADDGDDGQGQLLLGDDPRHRRRTAA